MGVFIAAPAAGRKISTPCLTAGHVSAPIPMKFLTPLSIAVLVALSGVGPPAQAHGPGVRHHAHTRGFFTFSIGAWPWYWASPVYYPVMPSGQVAMSPPPPVAYAPAETLAPAPVAYPRNAQSPQQTEADWQDCSRWATTQPSAMADAGVFQRAVTGCMDARGYSVR
jgi:hypothetical protein